MYTSDHPTALPQARRWAHIIEAEANQDATPMVAAAQYTRAFAAIAQAEMLDGIAAAQIAQSRAAQRMAEAAERQATAMERMAENEVRVTGRLLVTMERIAARLESWDVETMTDEGPDHFVGVKEYSH